MTTREKRVAVIAAQWRVGDVPAEVLRAPDSVYKILAPFIGSLEQEAVAVIALNARSRVIGVRIATLGTATSSLIEPREIFRDAIILNASSIVLAHNHPSGETSPSADDIAVTRRIQQAGKVLGIELLDHLIVTRDSFLSLKSAGVL